MHLIRSLVQALAGSAQPHPLDAGEWNVIDPNF
jgi:hypothetical protein